MRIIVVSASARFLAASCLKAGYDFQAIDYFSDWDLRRLCNSGRHLSLRMKSPRELLQVAQFSGWDAAIVSGGLENGLDLIEQLDRKVPVLGKVSFEIGRLDSLRYSQAVSEAVMSAGAEFPETRTSWNSSQLNSSEIDNQRLINASNQWLVKKLDGAGGRHVRLATASDTAKGPGRGFVFQRRVVGECVSAVFLARKSGAECEMLLSSRQLVGETELGAAEFAYCGSIGPKSCSPEVAKRIMAVGASIARRFGFEGVFGIDFVIDDLPDKTKFWVIDINPRIPASAEILELFAPKVSVVKLHVQACLDEDLPANLFPDERPDIQIGKAILYCRNPEGIRIDAVKSAWLGTLCPDPTSSHDREQWIADVPNPGMQIGPGDPVLSLFVRSHDETSAWSRLMDFARVGGKTQLNAGQAQVVSTGNFGFNLPTDRFD